MKIPYCKDCKWWRKTGESGPNNGVEQGRCHSRPPTAMPVVMPVMKNQITQEIAPQIVEVTLWPTLPASAEACGSFQKAPTKPQEADVGVKTNDRGIIQVE